MAENIHFTLLKREQTGHFMIERVLYRFVHISLRTVVVSYDCVCHNLFDIQHVYATFMHEHDTVRSLWVENETCRQGYLPFAGGLWILAGWRGIERTPQDVLQVLTNSIQSGSVTREEESYGRSWRRSWLQNMHSFHTFFISPTVCTQTPINRHVCSVHSRGGQMKSLMRGRKSFENHASYVLCRVRNFTLS